MIGRVWRGWAPHMHADAFERAIATHHYPTLLGKPIPGFRGSQLLRLTRAGQTEFTNIMWFDSMDAVRDLTHGDVNKPLYLPPESAALLRRYDTRVEHFDVRAVQDPV